MKKVLTVIMAAVVAAACSPERDALRTGDLIFIGIPGNYVAEGMDQAIVEATASASDELNLIHALIAEVEGDDVWVIDATIKRGVDRHPLDTLIKDFTLADGSMPIFLVKRLKKGFRPEFIDNAKSFCGLPYDQAFLPDNGALYCTELIRDSYRQEDGTYIFPEAPMNFKNAEGEFPPYWEWLFGLLDMPIPQDVAGTNPHDMAILPILKDVDVDILSLKQKK